MNLTQKEQTLLKDLKDQEQLCIEKYRKYATDAKSTQLQSLLNSIADAESSHHQTIMQMMNGQVENAPFSLSDANDQNCGAVSYDNENDRNADAFLCKDLLATEKHASSLYDTCVFEFTDPQARKMLNHIQAEEQQHGQKLYAYMSNNGMYN